MKKVAILITLLLNAMAAPADDSPLSQVTEYLSKIAENMNPVASVERNGRVVTLSYRTRKFMMHNRDKLGHYSEKAYEKTGPRYNGLIVRVTVQDGRYDGSVGVPLDFRWPYWVDFINAYPIAKGKQHLLLSISYGNRTDREIIKNIKEMFSSMVDDDPKIKAR